MINEKDIADYFKLFSNDGRLKIISSLATDNLTVNEIVEKTQLSQSLVSQQLKLLKNARILTNEKIGKTVTYSIYDRHILHLLKDVAEHLMNKREEIMSLKNNQIKANMTIIIWINLSHKTSQLFLL